ncbi:ABC transporter substrate-binding protein [Microbacterium esteraromaticum]|uniref:ABC transporter substrate-binding protein n=1 Tax=Microbacterium esteraromaticum TaxID=57043 RepID=UPI00195DFCAF|nr:ABC transporter substrate-binding protein [Microbacterium esteraromaticum]MBM7466260.1 polar amino acid transport system substrate-binding protein [Microbacterium esteraromaticum]
MRLRTTRAVVITAALALAASLAACSSSPETESAPAPGAEGKADLSSALGAAGVLVAADSGSVKPLKYTEAGSPEMQGLIVDLTKEYAKRLGLDVKFEKVSSDAVIPGVLAKRYDVALAAGDFAERRKTLDFVDLVEGGVVLIVQKGNPAGISGRDDLCGARLAIVKGSIQQGYADEEQKKCADAGKPPIDIQGYADGPTATLALQSARVDVEWSDLAVANQLVADEPEEFELAGEPEHLAPYGVGIPKDNTALRDAIFEALTEMKEDGTYDRILEDWNQSSLGLKKIEINGSKF